MISLEIVTPEKKVVDTQVSSVNIPTEKGQIGILENHAPLISALRPGLLSFNDGKGTERMVVSGGFVEISNNKVSVLADIAEGRDDIDVETAKSDQAEATRLLGEWKGTEEEFEVELEKLEKAQARLELSGS